MGSSWLIAGGTPLPKIQQRLGHESIQTTIDVYGGLLADTDDQVDAVVGASFSATAPVAEMLAGGGAEPRSKRLIGATLTPF